MEHTKIIDAFETTEDPSIPILPDSISHYTHETVEPILLPLSESCSLCDPPVIEVVCCRRYAEGDPQLLTTFELYFSGKAALHKQVLGCFHLLQA
jgi:hypothetical protein